MNQNNIKYTPILMSSDNPTGHKLEDLLAIICKELLDKTNRVALDSSDKADTIIRNNMDIIGKLRDARSIQLCSMRELDQLGPDNGPTGKYRIGTQESPLPHVEDSSDAAVPDALYIDDAKLICYDMEHDSIYLVRPSSKPNVVLSSEVSNSMQELCSKIHMSTSYGTLSDLSVNVGTIQKSEKVTTPTESE